MTRGLDIEVDHGLCTVGLAGRLDARTAAAARAALGRALDHGTGDLVVQATDLEIWDSAGLGVLVGIGRRARREQRRLVLCGVQPREARLLRATRLSRMMVVEPATPALMS